MNPDSPNQRPQLRQNQNQNAEQHLAEQTSATQQAGLEFATGEEAIRHDASQTPLPPAIAERLRKSIENEPKKSESWWKKIFGS